MTSVIFSFKYWSWPLRSLKIIFRHELHELTLIVLNIHFQIRVNWRN